MLLLRVFRGALLALIASGLVGCSASGPAGDGPAASRLPSVDSETGYTNIVSGAADSLGWQSGSEGAVYRYRFRQIAPGSSNFTFRDREVSFYFRPSTDALHFQVENLTDRPIWIDWDRSTFLVPQAGTDRVAHASTLWQDRNATLATTQIAGQQRYGDYTFPMSYLLDPGGRADQLHRRLLPEDDSATQFTDVEFGVDLVFTIDDRPRTYTFRFKVASVIPN